MASNLGSLPAITEDKSLGVQPQDKKTVTRPPSQIHDVAPKVQPAMTTTTSGSSSAGLSVLLGTNSMEAHSSQEPHFPGQESVSLFTATSMKDRDGHGLRQHSHWTVSLHSVRDVNDDDNLFSLKMMRSFKGAFPNKSTISVRVLSHLETLKTLRDDDIASSPLDAAGGSSAEVVGRSPTGTQMTHTNTMRLMHRPSALPEAANEGQLQWRNINIFVGDKSDGKQILHNFSGEIASGQLLAVMGGSGAGKSTFLDALSGRSNLNQLTVEGELAINGYKFDINNQELIRSIATYVPQSDVLCPTQTVEEALMFYANLKLASHPEEVRKKRVDYLIEVLHLGRCRNTYIGDEAKRGISGGEKRRCSIAAELLNDADTIFLDEPTSGLDAYTAARTIKTLKQFCLISNKMVIAVIHQPAVEVFYLFDQLIVLGAGRPCYASAVTFVDEYFADKINPTQNPADVVIYEAQREPDHYAQRWANDHDLNPFADALKQSDFDSKWDLYPQLTLNMIKGNANELEIEINTNTTAPWCTQFGALMHREVLTFYRTFFVVTLGRILTVTFLAALISAAYWQCGANEYNIYKKAEFLYFSTMLVLMYSLVATAAVFPSKKQLLQRESRSGNYSVSSWALSFQIIEIPREAVIMAIFAVVVPTCAMMNGSIASYWIAYLLLNIASGSWGHFTGAMAPNATMGVLLMIAPLIGIIFLSGVWEELSSFEESLAKIGFSPMYLAANMLQVIEFGNREPIDRYIYPSRSTALEICPSYWDWYAYDQARTEFEEDSEGMNCTEMNATLQDWADSYGDCNYSDEDTARRLQFSPPPGNGGNDWNLFNVTDDRFANTVPDDDEDDFGNTMDEGPDFRNTADDFRNTMDDGPDFGNTDIDIIPTDLSPPDSNLTFNYSNFNFSGFSTFAPCNSTTWAPEEDDDPSMWCQPNVTSSMIFNYLEIEEGKFGRWIAALCISSVVLRVMAVVILYFIQREWFSLIWSMMGRGIRILRDLCLKEEEQKVDYGKVETEEPPKTDVVTNGHPKENHSTQGLVDVQSIEMHAVAIAEDEEEEKEEEQQYVD